MEDLWALFGFALVVGCTAGGAILASFLLGSGKHGRWTAQPYEGGIVSNQGNWLRYGARFYLISIFFVIFDVESAFIYAWAVSARESGWTGFAELLVFVGLLVLGLVYVWRNGALDFASPMRRGRTYAINTTFGEQPPLPGSPADKAGSLQ